MRYVLKFSGNYIIILLVVGVLIVGLYGCEGMLPTVPPTTGAELSNPNVIVTTTENIGRGYEILDLLIIYEQFPGFSFRGDPLVVSLDKAYQRAREKVLERGGDALIGLRIEFSNRTMRGEEGRVLLYGTVVKFKP